MLRYVLSLDVIASWFCRSLQRWFYKSGADQGQPILVYSKDLSLCLPFAAEQSENLACIAGAGSSSISHGDEHEECDHANCLQSGNFQYDGWSAIYRRTGNQGSSVVL